MSGEQPKLTEQQRQELEEKLKSMSPSELAELQKQQCIFCQIISGKINSQKIYEDDRCLAVLDINPAAKGHILILPKEHYSIMPQIPDKELGHFFIVGRALSQLLLKVLRVSGTNLFIANGSAAGQRSAHFLFHVIPRKEGDGVMEFSEKIISKEMQQKVKTAVGHKLNLLLGVNDPEPETAENEQKPSNQDITELSESKIKPKSTGKISPPTSSKKSTVSKNKPANQTKSQPIPTPEEEANPNNGPKIDLDDIANLFK